MTDTTIREALAGATADVLERMFFLETLGEAEESGAEAETVTVGLSFEGDPPGRFLMRIARPMAQLTAADFLGEDPESLTGRQSADVTLELANMICGAVLSRIESSATFRLGTPQIVTEGSGEDTGPWPPEHIRYTVETDSGRLTAAIHMEERSCPSIEEFAS